jgi:hypothetical protein
MAIESSLTTAREIVTVAKFLATEAGLEFDETEVDSRLCLLGIATEVLKARAWHDEIDDFKEGSK